MLKRRLIALLALTSCLAAENIQGRAARPLGPAPVRPDVVVVILDDVGDSDIDDPSVVAWTPTIQGLAASGVRYRHAYAHAKCHPTRDSLLYSRWLGVDRGDACAAPVHGLTHSMRDYSLFEMFDGAGYATLHVGKMHTGGNEIGLGELTPNLWGADNVRHGVFQGDECQDSAPGTAQNVVNDGVVSTVTVDNTIACRDAFLSWWASTPSPRFAVVNFGAAHSPFAYPDPSLLPAGYPPCGLPCTNRKEYEAEIVGVDTALGEMLEAIGASAYVVLLGDNGTPGDHPTQPPSVANATRPDQDPSRVKLTTYQEGIRVPLIISGPGIVVGESQALVHVVDLFPTLARVASIQPYPDALVQGVSFAGTLIGLPGQRTQVFAWNDDPTMNYQALIERNAGTLRKLLVTPTGAEEFYDLSIDPDEAIPLALSGADYERISAKLAGILAGGA